MKKILILLLAGAIAIGSAACTQKTTNTNNPNPSDPSEFTSENSEPPSPGNKTESGPTETSNWETQNILPPNVASPETEEVVALKIEAGDVKVNRVVSPLSKELFDSNKAKDSLKKNPLFKDYVFGTENTERGKITLYSDVGQQNRYEYTEVVCATKNYYNTQSYFSDLVVTYTGDTAWFNGWKSLKVEIKIPLEEVTKETQNDVYEALCSVFGEEYAEYLCYAPATEDTNMSYELVFDNCKMTFRRNLSNYGLTFLVSLSHNLRNSFESYSGDYEPMLGTPEYFFDIFSEEMGEMNMRDYASVGSKMLKENFSGYSQTLPDYTSGYYYRVFTGDNGHKLVRFDFTGLIGQEEVGKLAAPDFEIEYEVILNGDDVVDIEGKAKCAIGQVGNNGDRDVAFKDFLKKGIIMLNCMLDADLNLTEFTYNTVEDKNTETTRDITILNLNKKVTLEVTFGETFVDTYVGYVNIKF